MILQAIIVWRKGEYLGGIDAVVVAKQRHGPLSGVALLSVPRCQFHQCHVREVMPVNVYQSYIHIAFLLF